MWPQRLTRTKAASTPYEGCFVIAYRVKDGAAVEKQAKEIEHKIRNHPSTATDSCFASIYFENRTEISSQELQVCHQKFPRKCITAEEALSKGKKQEHTALPVRPKKKQSTSADENAPFEKGKPFRTAGEVFNRLKYDDKWDIDRVVLGYVDRHSAKMQEKPANDWVRETTAEEFIPEHRIEYFKRVGEEEFLWHKTKKVDNIFGKKE